MSENQTHSYINVPAATKNKGGCCGCRVKVTVLRVAVVLAVVLIAAYVFDGVSLFFHTKECASKHQSTTNQITVAPELTTPHTCTCPPPPAPPTCPPPRRPFRPKP
ncbi:hypothetical protein NL108_009871 [Boleophthalmus pectinirostris]|nr:hypothetical protein NL108_009871 [Boleophthalmus pectinirostris]